MTEDKTTATAPEAAVNGAAPKRKFGSANNFSSENFVAGNGGARRGRGRDRRNNRNRKPETDNQFDEQTIAVDRVSRTVKGGRRLRFKALVVVGDRGQKVGIGVAKGRDVQQAIEKASTIAKKSMITIPIENETIPHDIEIKFGGARVLLKPAIAGTGIIAGGVVRTIIGVTGISNLVTKSLGSTNKVNIAYATIKALGQVKPRTEWIGWKPAKKATAKKEDK